jgi:hypothetical protein
MATINYPVNSPYSATPQLSWRLGRYQHRAIAPAPTDTRRVLTSRYHHRPDILAFDIYGTPELWWVFMLRNMNLIRDPIYDFVTGIEVVVPSAETIRAAKGRP